MDAMDFDIVLSPNDKFDFTVSKQPGQRPVMGWADTSCIVGPPAGAQSYQFPKTRVSGNNNSYVYNDSALDAGHIEVLSMAALKVGDYICFNPTGGPDGKGSVNNRGDDGACNTGEVNLATAATHVNGATPPDCASVRTVLKTPTLTGQLVTALSTTTPTEDQNTPGDAPNSLVGRYVLTVPGRGIEGGGDAIAIQNSDLPLSAQSPTPCVNCVSSYNWDKLEYDHPHLGDMPLADDLLNFETGMEAVNVAGDWSNNPGNSVGVDWVMNFPTKYLYTQWIENPDPVTKGHFQMLKQTPNDLPAAAGTPVVSPWPFYAGALNDDPDPASRFCLNTDPSASGIEEETGTNQEVVSPSPTASLEFCNEVNVLTFEINGQAIEPSYIATNDADGDSRRTVVTFDVSSTKPVYRGWSLLDLMWGLDSEGDQTGANPASVTGVIYSVRDTDQAAINNASLTDLQKNVGIIGQ
jgi:hypothetical protein